MNRFPTNESPRRTGLHWSLFRQNSVLPPCIWNLPRRYDMNGRSQMPGGKTGFCRKRWMQTGSSETLIGWKCGKTTFVPLWDRMEGRAMGPNGGSMAMDSVHVLPPLKIWNAERLKLDFAERDKCKPVLLRLSLAGYMDKPLMSLYGTKAGHC